MIPELRHQFNAKFTPEKYKTFLKVMDERCGTPVKFRIAETPCFFPNSLMETMVGYGKTLIRQLESLEYRKVSFDSIPEKFNVPRETSHPLFVAVDFGLVRDANGNLQPKLVEMQGFPSLYAYQAMLAQVYQEVFELDGSLQYLLGGLDWEAYKTLLRKAIVGEHDPANVILLEIDPLAQKTLPDFVLTERLLGIKTVSISDVKKVGKYLFYMSDGKRIPIHRIYNRVIVDELVRKKLNVPFEMSEDIEVEWAGHPNWYFRMSKFSLPYLKHESVPHTRFLHRVEPNPKDLVNHVIKPLYSFAGIGVIMNPTKEDLASIPKSQHSHYILQEKMDFAPIIETPAGPTKAEIRIMYIWQDELIPVITIVRLGRGLMMGVDQNRNMEWVGASAGFWPAQ